MIPPGLYRRDNKCNYKRTISGDLALRLCSTWWDSNVSTISRRAAAEATAKVTRSTCSIDLLCSSKVAAVQE